MIKTSFSLIFVPQLRTYTVHILLSDEDNNAMLVIVFTLFFIISSAEGGQGRKSQRWYKYKCRLGFLKKTVGYVLVSVKRKQNLCGVIFTGPVKENFISFSKFQSN